jgi:hypothetical protein
VAVSGADENVRTVVCGGANRDRQLKSKNNEDRAASSLEKFPFVTSDRRLKYGLVPG